jgi:hypothetical protein
MKREIRLAENLIVEALVQPSRNPALKATPLNLVMKRRGGSNVFDASDNEFYRGIVKFHGTEGRWSRWIYQLSLRDGRRIEGEGRLTVDGLYKKRTFFDTDGSARYVIEDRLKSVDAEEYRTRYDEIVDGIEPPPPPEESPEPSPPPVPTEPPISEVPEHEPGWFW